MDLLDDMFYRGTEGVKGLLFAHLLVFLKV